jgi:hypothetical protein
MMGREGFLQGIEPSVGFEAFDGLNLTSVGLDAEKEARPGRKAVEQNGAGAADPMLAPQVRPRVAKVVAYDIGKGPARLDLGLMEAAVNGNLYSMHIFHR